MRTHFTNPALFTNTLYVVICEIKIYPIFFFLKNNFSPRNIDKSNRVFYLE